MFLCARTRCRNRQLPADDAFDIRDYPDHFIIHYILNCGHTLCEQCLYMTVQEGERSYVCDQCNEQTNLTAQAAASIKSSKLSSSTRLKRINEDYDHEIPLDAYSFGLAFSQGRIQAAPVEIDDSEEQPSLTMEEKAHEKFKYTLDQKDEDHLYLKSIMPKAKRSKIIPLLHTMHHALTTHSECGHSLKVLGNMERKLSKEFYLAKMRLRERFHVLHSLLQLEELRGITAFEAAYSDRKNEYAQVERQLCSLRRRIRETFELEHGNMEQLIKKRNLLIEAIAKPSRISWRQYEIADEFNFEIDGYLSDAIKSCLILDNTERATAITLEHVVPEAASSSKPLPLFRSPPEGSSNQMPEKVVITKDEIIQSNLLCGFKEEIVKLSKIHSPELFYCTLQNNPEKLNEMNSHIETWCTSVFTHPPPVSQIKAGCNIFIFSDTLKIWARAKILSINDNIEALSSGKKKIDDKDLVASAYNKFNSRSIDAELLDYGGVERVPYSKIRKPFDELFDTEKYPPLAIKCSLYDVKPRGEEWTELAVTACKDFCADRKLLMIVKEIVGDLYRVNLYQHEIANCAYNNASLRNVLISSQNARFQLNEADIIRYDIEPELQFAKPARLSPARTETVLVTEVQSPDLFYVTLYSNQESFHDLHEKLKVYFDLPEEPYIVYCPKKDLPCVALDKGTFYRAVVRKLLEPDKVEVEFVDFGHIKIIHNKNLRLIRDEFLRKPIQAIPCKLGDIAPIGGFKWTMQSIDKFKELIFGDPSGSSHIFNLSVIGYEANDKHIVNLRRYTGTEYISVNVALVSLKWAVSTGPISVNPTDTMIFSEHKETKLDDKIFKALEDFDVSGYNILQELVARNREANSSKIDSQIKIRMSHWIRPDEFYVQITTPEVRSYFVCYENKLADEFMPLLDDPVPPLQEQLVIGEPVVYVLRDDFNATWKRGIVTGRENEDDDVQIIESRGDEFEESNQDDPNVIYTIFARDYGFEVKIPRKHIWKLERNSQYLKDSDFCLRCHLSDLAPAGGGAWTKTALEVFGELVKKYLNDLYLYIQEKYLPKDPPDSVGVDLVAKETYIANALAPVTTRFHSFRSLLITRGIALPTREISLSDIENDPDSDSETIKQKSLPFHTKKTDSVLGYIRTARANIRKQMDNTTVHFYKDAEKPPCEQFVAIPTEVDYKLKIWFRVQKLEGPQPMNIVNRTINKVLKDQQELLPFAGDAIYGRACSAYFEFDKTWNRAEIIYPKDDDNILVRFVDYGNEMYVKKEHLSSQVFNPEIPKLALYGFLAECKPAVNEQNNNTLRNTIHSLIVDKKCAITWNNFSCMGDMQITVFLPNSNDLKTMLINQNLVIEEIVHKQHIPATMRNLIMRVSASGFKIPSINLEKDVYYSAIITGTFRENCTFFQVRPISNSSDDTDIVINDKNREYLDTLAELRAEVESFETAKEYKPGDCVAARFSDYQWYRAMVMEVVKTIFEAEYRVLYVDYGNTSVVGLEKLKKLPAKYLQYPECFAIPARVCNIKPAKEVYTAYLLDRMEQKVSSEEQNTLIRVKNDTAPWDIEVFKADPENPRVPKESLWETFFESGDLIKIETESEQLTY